jgi:hypothetical protein
MDFNFGNRIRIPISSCLWRRYEISCLDSLLLRDSPVGTTSKSKVVKKMIEEWAKNSGYQPHDIFHYNIDCRGGGSCIPMAFAWIGERPNGITELRVGDKLPDRLPRQFDRWGKEYNSVTGISGHQISLIPNAQGFNWSWQLDTPYFVDPLALNLNK